MIILWYDTNLRTLFQSLYFCMEDFVIYLRELDYLNPLSPSPFLFEVVSMLGL